MSGIYLTGVYDLDRDILLILSDEQLATMCRVNHLVYEICNDDNFWKLRSINKFGETIVSYKPDDEKYLQQYMYLLGSLKDLDIPITKGNDDRNLRESSYLLDDRLDRFFLDMKHGYAKLDSETLSKEAAHGNINIVEWIYNQGVPIDSYIALQLIRSTGIDAIKWLLNNNIIPDILSYDDLFDELNHIGDIDAIEWLISHGITPD